MPARAPIPSDDVAHEDFQPVDELERSLTTLIRLLTLPRLHDRLARRAGQPIERSAYVVLARLERLGSSRVSNLADALGVDASTASRQLGALERSGYVRRGSERGDARAASLSLTPSGKRTLAAVRRVRREFLEELVGEWPESDVCECARQIGRLVDELTNHAGEAR